MSARSTLSAYLPNLGQPISLTTRAKGHVRQQIVPQVRSVLRAGKRLEGLVAED